MHLAWSEAAAFDDAEFCAYAQEMARQINEGSPDKISEGLTLDGALVTCASKLFEFRKRADTVLQLGWRKIRKRMWSQVVCQDPFLEATRNGWMIAEATARRFATRLRCPTAGNSSDSASKNKWGVVASSGAASKAVDLGGERPLPSIARFRTASISDTRLGNEAAFCSDVNATAALTPR